MRTLSSAEFERVLHPVFEEDELTLILIGALRLTPHHSPLTLTLTLRAHPHTHRCATPHPHPDR
eukprot:scaffold38454_cov28-Phaeocystis_antarctica.AAC.3